MNVQATEQPDPPTAGRAGDEAQQRKYIGLDLGGTHIKAGLLDAQGKVLLAAVFDTPVDSTPGSVVQHMSDLTRGVASEAGVPMDDIAAVGIGVPGLIDSATGVVKACVNLKDWHDVPLRELAAEAIGKPVIVDNDANAASYGEFSVAMRHTPELQHLALITLGTGVGAGIVLNRQVFHGGGGMAGEVGHMVVVPGGHLCACGQRGCLEQYTSATSMVRDATELIATGKRSFLAQALSTGEKITTRHVFAAAEQGDRMANRLIEDAAKYLAIACINLCRVIDLEMIVIGGGVANAGEALAAPLRQAFYDQTWNIAGACEPTLQVTTLGNDAGYIGAAALAKAMAESR
ncbi:MAG: ROK family protein [Phycisphaerales bacterium JB063]